MYARLWQLLADAIFIPNNESYYWRDREEAERLLREFVRQFNLLFGAKYMTYKVYLL